MSSSYPCGYPRTEENTYVRPSNGNKLCRHCLREGRERRAQRKQALLLRDWDEEEDPLYPCPSGTEHSLRKLGSKIYFCRECDKAYFCSSITVGEIEVRDLQGFFSGRELLYVLSTIHSIRTKG